MVREYSSYCDYLGVRSGSRPRPYLILSEFPSHVAYCEYVERPDSNGLALIGCLRID
jgi:hypothetical protein